MRQTRGSRGWGGTTNLQKHTYIYILYMYICISLPFPLCKAVNTIKQTMVKHVKTYNIFDEIHKKVRKSLYILNNLAKYHIISDEIILF